MKAHSTMGTWKSRIMKKSGKGSRTQSKKARIYLAYPPEGGWKGGRPEDNGLRRGMK